MTQPPVRPRQVADNVFLRPDYLYLPEGQARVLDQLRDFLDQHDTRVGRVLSGRERGTWQARDMRKLETLLLKEIDDSKALSKMLRVLRKVVSAWAMRHLVAVAYPRIPVIPNYAKNPIGPDTGRLLCRYREWKNWLEQWLDENGTKNLDRYHSIATPVPLIVSAILFGGLCSITSVVALLRAVGDIVANVSASKQRFYVDLQLSLPRTSETEYRAWEPDTVTVCLLLRTDPAAVQGLLAPPDSTLPDCAPSDRVIAGRLRKFFQEELAKHRTIKRAIPLGGIHSLIEAAQTVSYLELPPLVACYASRGLVAHSLSMQVIRRITIQDWYQNSFRVQQIAPRAVQLEPGRKVNTEHLSELPPDWLDPLRDKMRSKNRNEVVSGVSSLASDTTQTPLLRRLAEFAQALLTQRNKSDHWRALNGIRSTVVEVAKAIGPFVADGCDPVELSPEGLEHLYEIAVTSRLSSANTSSRKTKVIGALREFDAYLRIRHGGTASGQSVLGGQVEALGNVDANLITPPEYDKILKRIDSDLTLRRTPARLRIVRLLVISGYRCGLRRLEALHLKIRDLLLNQNGRELLGPVELLVRPSESHRLKSKNAKRRLPLEILLSPNELQELKGWYANRIAQSGVKTSDYLFGNVDRIDDFDVMPQTIFETINGFLQEITQSQNSSNPIHYHHLRHGFCTFGLLRLMTSADNPDYLPGCKWLSEFLRSDAGLDAGKLYRHHLPTRKHAYLVSGLMGHGSPSTSMTYAHCLSWLLADALARSSTMTAPQKTLDLATGVSDKTRERWTNSASGDPIWGQIWKWRVKTHAPSVASAITAAQSEMPDRAAPADWVRTIERFLHEMDFPGQSVAGAAKICGVEKLTAQGWWDRVSYLRTMTSGIGKFRHRFERAKSHPSSNQDAFGNCPVRPTHAVENEIISRYAPLLSQMNSDSGNRPVLQAGLDAYIHAVWFTKDFALFHHPDIDGTRARCFLDLLLALKIQLRDITCWRSRHGPKSGWVHRWRDCLGQTKYLSFKTRNSLGENSEASESWLAIESQFHFREPPKVMNAGLAGFRYLLVVGYIAFGSRN